ncbi:MAG TPA: hypothetical protein VFS00_12760, partial [Polyangiaceae bacterium]|nr:hypothetical protein [Polyangiaceae bacterium]
EGAWVSGVGFAGLDVASADGKMIRLVLDADLGPPESASGPLSPPPKSEALIHGFRLAIEGLPGGSAVRVGPLHVKAGPSGGLASNLVFDVPLAQGAPFYAWLAAPAAPPKAAALDYLNGSNGVVAALRLGGLTPVSVSPVPGSNPPRVRVEASPRSASFAAIL